MPSAGQARFARYAYPPNELGYCGPENTAIGELASRARDFDGAWPYLQAIADAAGSPMLTASVVEARVQLVDLLNAIPMLGRNLEHANVQHASIVRAILAGDPDRARRAMEEHVAGTAALLRGFLGETA